jgi:hypothetical protein
MKKTLNEINKILQIAEANIFKIFKIEGSRGKFS